MTAVIWDRLYFVYQACVVNPHMREEVSITFSTVVDRWVGGILWWIYCPKGFLPLPSTTTRDFLERKLAARVRLLHCPWDFLCSDCHLQYSEGLGLNPPAVLCVKPCSRGICRSRYSSYKGKSEDTNNILRAALPLSSSQRSLLSSCLDLFVSTGTLLTSVPCLPVIDVSRVSDISNITNTYEHMHLQYREHMGSYKWQPDMCTW